MHLMKGRGALACAGLVWVLSGLLTPRTVGQTSSGAPVIAPIPDREDTAYNGISRSMLVGFSFDISNSPTSVTATGHAASGAGFNDYPPYGFRWDNVNIRGGVYNVTVTAANASGSSSRSFRWVVHPSMFSYITPDKPSYTVGDVITLTATYPIPVVVTGSPYIELWAGKHAVYSSGSGTTTLRFQTTVTATDTTHRGLVAHAITAGNGSIATPDGASANLVGPASPNRAGDRAPTFDVVVPQSTPGGPKITGITPPIAGTYGPQRGVTIGLRVNFNARVVVTGGPSIVVRIGATEREFRGGGVTPDGTGITFSYGFAYQDPMNDDGFLRITGPIKLNGGTIKGVDGSDAELTFTAVDAPSVVFDATPPATPVVRSVTPASPAPEQSFVVAGTGEPESVVLFREGEGGPGSSGRAPVDAQGNWSATFTARPEGTYTFYASAVDSISNRSPETSFTVTVRTAGAPPPGVPVVSNATVAGQVGTAITPVQVAATNNPASFSAPALSGYGLTISASGLISGTPTAAANGVSVPVTATNAAGTSAAANITLNITAAPGTTPPPTTPPPTTTPPVTTPPPPTTTPPVTTPPPSTTPPPGTTLTPQTITFSSPVSGFVINQPVTLGATSSAGLPIVYTLVSGNATLEGNVLTPRGPGSIVVRASQAGSDTVAPASVDVDFGAPQPAAQTVAFAPPAEVMSDGRLTLSATSSAGLPVAWEIVSGAATLQGNVLVPAAASGTVTVRAVQAGNDSYAPAEVSRTLTIVPAGRLVNLSSRALAHEGDAARVFIAGFVVAGPAPKRILARGVGPGLAAFGVAGAAANPRLRVFDQAGRIVAENDDWSGADVATTFARVGAFQLPTGSRDAALFVTLAPGAYSLHVEAVAGQGVALAEVYDASDVPALELQQMVNISTRAFVGTGEGVLTAGFVVTGSAPKRILIRGIGPSLAAFGVAGALADPVLRLHHGNTLLAQNDDWEVPQAVGATSLPGGSLASGADIASASSRAGAFALVSGSKDAALLLTLAPGAYTVEVSGANNATGTALVEVYQAPAAGP